MTEQHHVLSYYVLTSMVGKSKSGFGFKSIFSYFCQIRGFGFGFEHRWICPSLLSLNLFITEHGSKPAARPLRKRSRECGIVPLLQHHPVSRDLPILHTIRQCRSGFIHKTKEHSAKIFTHTITSSLHC